jgi:hypothetical protein
VAFNLFDFHPIDCNDEEKKGPFRGCGICVKEYAGGDTHDSSVAVLHCKSSHNFHLGCILTFWDQEGKYFRECPECGEAPEINHEKVGIKPEEDETIFNSLDPSFALNVFEYRPKDNIFNYMEITEENSETIYRARKNFYDIPPRSSTGFEEREPDAQEEANRIYWLRENMHIICTEDEPLQWRGEVEVDPRASRHVRGDNHTDFQRAWNIGVRELATAWRSSNPPLPRMIAPHRNPSAYPPSRFPPAQEAAWLREQRRRRNRSRRRVILESGLGLGSLGVTFR